MWLLLSHILCFISSLDRTNNNRIWVTYLFDFFSVSSSYSTPHVSEINRSIKVPFALHLNQYLFRSHEMEFACFIPFVQRFSNIIHHVGLVCSIEIFKDATNAWKENERTLYVPIIGLKVKWSLFCFESSSMFCVCIVYIKVPVWWLRHAKPTVILYCKAPN